MLTNPSKIPRPGNERGCLPKFNKFFLVHRYHTSVLKFLDLCSQVFIRKVANRQTDRQTNAGH